MNWVTTDTIAIYDSQNATSTANFRPCVTRKCNLVCFMFWCQIESRPTNRWKWLVAATGAMYPCAKKFWGSKKKPPPTAWVIHCLRNFLPASRTRRDYAHIWRLQNYGVFYHLTLVHQKTKYSNSHVNSLYLNLLGWRRQFGSHIRISPYRAQMGLPGLDVVTSRKRRIQKRPRWAISPS